MLREGSMNWLGDLGRDLTSKAKEEKIPQPLLNFLKCNSLMIKPILNYSHTGTTLAKSEWWPFPGEGPWKNGPHWIDDGKEIGRRFWTVLLIEEQTFWCSVWAVTTSSTSPQFKSRQREKKNCLLLSWLVITKMIAWHYVPESTIYHYPSDHWYK